MTLGLAFWAGLILGACLASVVFAFWERWRSLRLGRFFAHAAHEINTPLTAINITALNFISGVFGEMSPEQVKWLELLREQAGRLGGVTGELRDVIHIMLSRDLRPQSQSVAAAELVEGALASLRREAVQGQPEIVVELPPDLPLVQVDRDRTIRTLASLIFHARKFRSAPPLRLSARRGGAALDVCLEYQGHPLQPGEARRSLRLLYPACARAGHSLCAVGLGLGALRALARLQGGDLDLRTEPDGRAVLTLSLPVARGT